MPAPPPTNSITLSGWTGAGYTFIDPETGAGGYIIDGGSNGAFLSAVFFLAIISIMVLTVAVSSAAGPAVFAFTFFVQLVSYKAFIKELQTSNDPTYLSGKAFLSVMSLLFLLVGKSGLITKETMPFAFLLDGIWWLIDTIPDFFTVFWPDKK